uniref:Uncharacterized protein n=1 Tax=Phytophthora fragariae TaxID=53985 RepID=A0A6A3DLX6_9STRA|nr:hypothetical protein PF009_g28539 [Phytophthora fragariae]
MAPKPKPRPPLPSCGYLLVSLGLRPEVLRALQDEARSGAMESKYNPIFNKVGKARAISRMPILGDVETSLPLLRKSMKNSICVALGEGADTTVLTRCS